MHKEGTWTSQTHTGHADRAKPGHKDPSTLPVRLDTKGDEVLRSRYEISFQKISLLNGGGKTPLYKMKHVSMFTTSSPHGFMCA